MENKRKIIVLSVLVIGIIGLVIGVTYAFFNYTRTGSENTLVVGRIYFHTNQNNTINLTNVFPVSSNSVVSNSSNTVTVGIEGDTTYTGGIEYLVTIDEVNNVINGKNVPISFKATQSNLGTSSNTYWESRGGNAPIYELTEEGIASNGKYVMVGYIPAGSTGVDGSVSITAYLDTTKVAVTDTIENGNIVVPGYDNGTDTNWINGRVAITADEWNSFATTPLSFKVRVEANEGIWVEEQEEGTPASCFTTSNTGIAYLRNTDMNVNTCVSKLTELLGPEEEGVTVDVGETYEAFCNGTGTVWRNTFQQWLDYGYFSPGVLLELESAGIITNNGYVTAITDYDASCGSDVIIPSKMNSQLINYSRNSNMNVNTCVSKFTEWWGPEEEGVTVDVGETYEAFCNGTGTIGGATFQEGLDMGEHGFPPGVLFELENVNIINKDEETVNASITYIVNGAFDNKSLTSVVVPDSIKRIGYQAFANNRLTCVDIPQTTSYESNSFDNNVTIHQGDGNSCPVPIIDNCFTGYKHNNEVTITDYNASCGTDVIIPSAINGASVTTIAAATRDSRTRQYTGSFANKGLTSVVIPDSVTTIGEHAFLNNQLINVIVPDEYFDNNSSGICADNSIVQRTISRSNSGLIQNYDDNYKIEFLAELVRFFDSNVPIVNRTGNKSCLSS